MVTEIQVRETLNERGIVASDKDVALVALMTSKDWTLDEAISDALDPAAIRAWLKTKPEA